MRAIDQDQNRMNATVRRLSVLLWITGIVMCGSLWAKTGPTITIQMLDSKTGRPITTSDFQVWLDRVQSHIHWVRSNKGGIGEITLPLDASVLSVHAQYGEGAFPYINCDPEDNGNFKWYSIAKIVASGMVAPNHCSRKKVVAKPGQFIFFVRPENWWERMQQ